MLRREAPTHLPSPGCLPLLLPGQGGLALVWTLTCLPFHRHDDIIGKISLSREAIAADPRGG